MSSSTRTRRPRSRRGSGDQLRGEILSAATRLLSNAENISEVSTRAVADAVGVSVMAIYHHFADKQALLDAVVTGAVAELDDVMRSAAGGAEDPLAALCAEVSAYVQFAVERPTHYRYATLEQRAAGTRGNELEDILAESVQRRLGTAVAACISSGFFVRADDPQAVTLGDLVRGTWHRGPDDHETGSRLGRPHGVRRRCGASSRTRLRCGAVTTA